GSGLMTERIAAPVGRAGARIERKDRVLGGGYALDASIHARMVASSRTKPENVMLYTGDARWLRAIESRPIAVGLAVTAADALAITGGTGARTFRNLGGDALLALGSGDDRHLTLAVGGRDFAYKPIHAFDWRGVVANARLDVVLWQTTGKIKSLELWTTLGFEDRRYASTAVTDICTPGAEPSSQCNVPTSLTRRDRYQRAAVELNWVGDVVATAGYQLTVIDSNSYGQSLVRHRISAAMTAELADKLFGTATATLQIDQYPDGVLIETDVQRQEFTNLEDENRSSLQVRIARELSSSWSLEARGAVWRDFGNTGAASFRRELVYGGVVYSR
ncbi:MAG TPA: hypothetical protein VFK02_09275, partial [Kofleriaceae bacterium]|nr:hypothetical protein [Kofleriaceae bacterium]